MTTLKIRTIALKALTPDHQIVDDLTNPTHKPTFLITAQIIKKDYKPKPKTKGLQPYQQEFINMLSDLHPGKPEKTITFITNGTKHYRVTTSLKATEPIKLIPSTIFKNWNISPLSETTNIHRRRVKTALPPTQTKIVQQAIETYTKAVLNV